MIERHIKELLEDVKKMVELKLIIPDYEIEPDSYVCFIDMRDSGKYMYHTGKLRNYPQDIQDAFVGLYLNEYHGYYKITGIYKISKDLR